MHIISTQLPNILRLLSSYYLHLINHKHLLPLLKFEYTRRIDVWLEIFFWLCLQRNYRFFFMFVFSTTLLCIYVHAFCWIRIRKIMNGENVSIWKAMTKSPASIVLIIYTFISVWFVGGLTVFHSYLISRNQVRHSFMILEILFEFPFLLYCPPITNCTALHLCGKCAWFTVNQWDFSLK